VANGKEMAEGDAIGALGEFFFRSNAIYLRAIEPGACREWQRTGRCPKGSKCEHHKTHDVKRSPRYIAHNAPTTESPSASPTLSPSSEAGSESPLCEPCAPLYHSTEHVEGVQNQNNTICHNWAQCGACNFNERCHFAASHTLANLPANAQPASAQFQQAVQYSPTVQYSPETQFNVQQQFNTVAHPVLLSPPAAHTQWPSPQLLSHQTGQFNESPQYWHSEATLESPMYFQQPQQPQMYYETMHYDQPQHPQAHWEQPQPQKIRKGDMWHRYAPPQSYAPQNTKLAGVQNQFAVPTTNPVNHMIAAY